MSKLSPDPRRLGAISRGCALGAVGVAVIVLVAVLGVGTYNKLQAKKTTVEAQVSKLDSAYKRRFDLIPNLVETVKGAADFERGTLEAVTNARAEVGKVQLPAGVPTDPAQLEAYLKAQQALSGALSRLIAVAESYPELKATERFGELQAQLEGTENRINTARQDYIESVRDYNVSLRTFPNSVVAGITGFKEMPQFSIEATERETPKVDFGGKK
jgi:LemA protein